MIVTIMFSKIMRENEFIRIIIIISKYHYENNGKSGFNEK